MAGGFPTLAVYLAFLPGAAQMIANPGTVRGKNNPYDYTYDRRRSGGAYGSHGYGYDGHGGKAKGKGGGSWEQHEGGNPSWGASAWGHRSWGEATEGDADDGDQPVYVN